MQWKLQWVDYRHHSWKPTLLNKPYNIEYLWIQDLSIPFLRVLFSIGINTLSSLLLLGKDLRHSHISEISRQRDSAEIGLNKIKIKFLLQNGTKLHFWVKTKLNFNLVTQFLCCSDHSTEFFLALSACIVVRNSSTKNVHFPAAVSSTTWSTYTSWNTIGPWKEWNYGGSWRPTTHTHAPDECQWETGCWQYRRSDWNIYSIISHFSRPWCFRR